MLPPYVQVDVEVHHPQSSERMQAAQSVNEAHPVPHSAAWKCQLGQREPSVGPALTPLVHDEVVEHQPQPDAAVQRSQVECRLQLALSQLWSRQLPPPQVPLKGPCSLPGMQTLSRVHQPQPAVAVQLPQSVLEEQLSPDVQDPFPWRQLA